MLEFSGETHPGCVYTHNEDAIGWSIPIQMWFVADGMGGHASGELASSIVKESILQNASDDDEVLKQAILTAHQAVAHSACEDDTRHGMGSTIVMAHVQGRNCRVLWCGDSRAYLWRGNKLDRISRDHSLLEEMIESGELDRGQTHLHPQSNVLTQALGLNEPEPDEKDVQLRSDDWILLCSDGLHDELTDQQIANVLRVSRSPNQATQLLIDAAIDEGAKDNVSVIVLRCPKFTVKSLVERIANALGIPRNRF